MHPLRLALAAPALIFASPVCSAEQPIDPLRFFAGRTEVDGVVKILFHSSYKTHSTGEGVIHPDGSLTLVQHVADEGKAPHDRRWLVRRAGAGRFDAAMSEAIGPVTIQRVGESYRFNYRIKDNLHVEQMLTPIGDGRSARNVGKVRRMGIVVATTTGLIRKV